MSDHWIIIIPEEAGFVPDKGRQAAAVELAKGWTAHSAEVVGRETPEMQFIHCGSNFMDVHCPVCGGILDVDWWGELMDEEYKLGFPLKKYPMPCCGHEATLHEIDSDWPQGFARFSIEMMNANIGRLDDRQIQDVEKVLGCEVRVIYRRL